VSGYKTLAGVDGIDGIGGETLCASTFIYGFTHTSESLCSATPDEKIPIFLTIIMGLQHSFAMVGGLITPPLVIFRFTVCGFGPAACPQLEQYAISAALITSGLCTFINVSKIRIPYSEKIFGRIMFLGAGVLSVMGTSFTFLPVFEISIGQMKNDGVDGRVAYGRMLGTSMVCCLLEVCFSVLPIRIVKNIFPPLVTAITVILIGVALIGTGMKYLGGGVVCAEVREGVRERTSNSRNNGVELPRFAVLAR